MGKDIHIEITKLNKETKLYDKIALYKKLTPQDTPKETDINGFREISIDLGRNYEMWDGMMYGDEEDGYGIFPKQSLDFDSLEPSFKEYMTKISQTSGYFDFMEVNLAELKIYILEHPFVTDYNAEWPEDWKPGDDKPVKENPIKELYNAICEYISIAENYYWTTQSNYKVLFYFDW